MSQCVYTCDFSGIVVCYLAHMRSPRIIVLGVFVCVCVHPRFFFITVATMVLKRGHFINRVLAKAGKRGGCTLLLLHPPAFRPPLKLCDDAFLGSRKAWLRKAAYVRTQMCKARTRVYTRGRRNMAAGRKGLVGQKTLYGYLKTSSNPSTSGAARVSMLLTDTISRTTL